MTKPADWLNNPEYVKLVKFLVKKTKNGKKVLKFKKLAREFRKHSNSELNIRCLKGRIDCFRRNILILSHLDTDTKAKLLFGLSASADYGFLRELRKEAEVTVDDFNRIIHYKKRGGGLELNGIHKPREAEWSNNQILEFLAKKVKKTSGIIALHTLAKQFKAEMSSSQTDCHLYRRIREATKQIYESELFDEDMKVKMIFATSTQVEEYALEELRKNAFVVVDKRNIIIEYKKKDGSLYLNRKDSQIKCGSRSKTVDESEDMEDSDEDVEEQHGDSSDDSEEEKEELTVTTSSGRRSKRRFSDASSFNDKDDKGPSSQRNEISKSSNNPTTSSKKRKALEHTNGSDKRKKPVVEAPPEDRHDDDYSFDISNQYNDEQRVELEPFNASLNDDTTLENVINNGDDFVEEILAPTRTFVAPKQEESLMDVKTEKLPNNPIDTGKESDQDSTSSDDVKTPLKLLLEVFHHVIYLLDFQILSDIQKKIERELEECKKAPKVRMISNKRIYLSLGVCLLKVNESSGMKEENGIDSISLKKFQLSLDSGVNALKLPILYNYKESLKRMIEEPRNQDKVAPVTSVRNALQNAIDIITTF